MSKETPPPEDNRIEKMRAYRRAYWERFHETRRRIYGTVPKAEYDALEARARAGGRSVWEQLHHESQGYNRGEYVPPEEVTKNIEALLVQLRRIGNNINQIAIETHLHGKLKRIDTMAQCLEEVEDAVRDFTKKPWGKPPTNADDDTESEP